MAQTSLSSCATLSDGPAGIKGEPEDDFNQTVENQTTDECDRKEDIPIINIQPIVTNQSEPFKIEDTPKVKLESHKIGCPWWESSFQPFVKLERCSIASDCKQSPKTTNIVRDDDGSSPLVELPGEVDCNDDIKNVNILEELNRVIPTDMEDTDTSEWEPSDDMKSEGM